MTKRSRVLGLKKAGYTEEMLKELDKLQEKSLDMFKKMQETINKMCACFNDAFS